MCTPICRLSDLISALQKAQDIKGNLPVTLYDKHTEKLFKLASVFVTEKDEIMLSLERIMNSEELDQEALVQLCTK